MGVCESANNKAAAQQTSAQAAAQQTATNATQSNTGIVDTVKNIMGSNTTTQQQNNNGIIDTVKNAIGANTTTNNAQPSKMETVAKVGKFVVENKEALGKLVS